uniref:hypothetical protein n=1 Tax=uncultured Ruminococcus sp. TaxID=165186 RepID=UPI002607B88D
RWRKDAPQMTGERVFRGAHQTKNGCRHHRGTAPVFQIMLRLCRKKSLASTAAAVVVAAATAEAITVTAAAEQNHKQNNNPAASTVTLKTHNTQSPLCQIFLKQTVFCLFHSTLYAEAKNV